MSTEIAAFSARIEHLERRLSRWRLAAGTVTIGAICLLLLGANAVEIPETIKTQELHLVDREGRPRLLLFVTREGHPKVLFADADGQPRAQLTSEQLSFEERGTALVNCGIMGGQHGITVSGTEGKIGLTLKTR